MTSSQTALIVGGTAGIGLATARRLQSLGAAVHVAARSIDRTTARADSDPGLTAHRADGTDREQIAGLAQEVGPIDWLVITLSGSDGPGPVADLDLDILRGAFEAKFWGHITTIQAALPHLTPDGSITFRGPLQGLDGPDHLARRPRTAADGQASATVGELSRMIWGEDRARGRSHTKRLLRAMFDLRDARFTVPGYDMVHQRPASGALTPAC